MGLFNGLKQAAGKAEAKKSAPVVAKKPAPEAPPDGDFFAGMDVATYPGDGVMQSLIKNTNLKWTGFYLTLAPSQGHKLGWMDKHEFLRNLGWGIAPIYVGRQVKSVPNTDHRMTPENGTKDGEHAAQLARLARLPFRSTIYLDFENGAPLLDAQKAYYAPWAAEVRRNGLRPGVYCVASLAAGLGPIVADGVVWAANYSKFERSFFKPPFPQPDPTLGAINASLWQLRGNVTIEYDHIAGGKRHTVVDLSRSDVQDPLGIV
jgi:hypothetical protein